MSRKTLIVLLLLAALLVAVGAWAFWPQLLWVFNGFQTLDKDQLELWEKRRDLVWPVLAAVGLGIWGLVRLLWTQAATEEKTASTQRAAEITYLKTLLQERKLPLVEHAYTALAGDYCADRQLLPDDWMPTLYRHQAREKQVEPTAAQGKPVHHNDLLQAFTHYQRLVLLGEPGAGKTFSLWKIAADRAHAALKDAKQPIPVVIPLNKWTRQDQSLSAFVLEQMKGLAPQFPMLYDTHRLLPLLDALNEIPFDQRDEKLPQVREWLARDFPALLLTCRERDYAGLLVQDMDRLMVEPLNPVGIHRFLHNYFGFFAKQGRGNGAETADALFWQLAGGDEMRQSWQRWQNHKPDWKTRLRNFWKPYTQPTWENFWTLREIPKDWFWESRHWWDSTRQTHLNNPRSLLKLAENPYLLNLITVIYTGNQQQLPNSRIGLFQQFVDALLMREEQEKDKAQAKRQIPVRDVLLDGLKQLAWQLQDRGGLHKQVGQNEVRTTMPRAEVEDCIMPLALLDFAHAASLLELTSDSVRFSHQLLQEFFTAQHFAEKRRDGLKASSLWQKEKWWEANGWEEAAKLAAEYEADPKPFLQWLAEGQPKLAAEIAREQGLLDDTLFVEFRAQWQNAITDIEHYPNPHERHAISTVLAWLDWDDRPGIGLDANGLPDIDWVEIDGYQMSRYPVTNAQFRAFEQAGGYETDEWWEGLQKPDAKPNHWKTESNCPVERVSWYDAVAFCRWLSVQTGKTVRLPTKQEWENAARGADGREYPWGDAYKTGYANINETLVYDKVGEYFLQETSAVGVYPNGQSPYGLLDMSGNVWEWCSNRYDKPEVIEPDLSGPYRVLRGGGSWDYSARYARSAYRSHSTPDDRYYDIGFRLALGQD